MAIFENCSLLLELKNVPFKTRTKLKSAITDNGGRISYVVNKQCTLVVTSSSSCLSSSRLRSIQKHLTPVVGVDYIFSCLEKGVLLAVDDYQIDTTPSPTSPSLYSSTWPVSFSEQAWKVDKSSRLPEAKKPRIEKTDVDLETPREYTENDRDLPEYPSDFQVAKYSIYHQADRSTWSVVELHSAKRDGGRQYRVVRYWKESTGVKQAAVRDKMVFLSTSEKALEVYQTMGNELKTQGFNKSQYLPPLSQDLGSEPLKQLLLEERLYTGRLSQEVGLFVELLWTEALGSLGNILRVQPTNLSLNDVTRAEGLLIQAQKKLSETSDIKAVTDLMDEVYTLLPHRTPFQHVDARLISQKLDLCQLIRDVLNASELTGSAASPSCLGKYRALRCGIERVPPDTAEFQQVTGLLQDRKVAIQQVLRVSRMSELQMFKKELGNVKALLHSSSPSNFVGILSRGLLLPRIAVEHHGIERTDIGNLGSGIYFSDSLGTSVKYSKPTATDGSCLLLVCDVALGNCMDLKKRDYSLAKAPEGYDSVHGVRKTAATASDFEDDEYVVYSPDQVKLKYVVQFSREKDSLKEFNPIIDTTTNEVPDCPAAALSPDMESVENFENPLAEVKAGLLNSSGQQLPLEAVHVKCKLMDLLSQVIIFQTYTNESLAPIEAKYVFPLDDSAAVCGFEAFINGKHVVGQVKEKQEARKEYKQAIKKGHGAYLMDQDASEVFTISVGNLPPQATVLIKITFVSELIVRDGSVLFSLPGSVAPWQQREALNQTIQTTVETVTMTDDTSQREFSLDMAIEMPYEILELLCTTHKIRIKKTDCKAVVSVLPGETLGSDGFQLSVSLSKIHLPRMWVENHPDKDSQACMLVFYPEFELSSSSSPNEVVILVDSSESMQGEALANARWIALQILKALYMTLDPSVRLNVIFFGTEYTEAIEAPCSVREAFQKPKNFIRSGPTVGGATDLWRPLQGLSLLPPSRGLRNLVLLSDGHIQNQSLTLQLVRENATHTRLFTCGLSSTANRHMLRTLAEAGGGAYEFFDTKTKDTWSEKVRAQVKRMASPGCSSVAVKWQQFSHTAPPPVQAPSHLHALFNDCHTLVYGFVPHCTQATLLGSLGGQEVKTMVSTSELQKTKGTFLHKLTARAVIRDYEDGRLDANEAQHEGKKSELKTFIVELSKEFSLLTQFTSFVAIEERDSDHPQEGFTDVPKLIAQEDVDFLPYLCWMDKEPIDEEKFFVDEIFDCDLYLGRSESSDDKDILDCVSSSDEMEPISKVPSQKSSKDDVPIVPAGLGSLQSSARYRPDSLISSVVSIPVCYSASPPSSVPSPPSPPSSVPSPPSPPHSSVPSPDLFFPPPSRSASHSLRTDATPLSSSTKAHMLRRLRRLETSSTLSDVAFRARRPRTSPLFLSPPPPPPPPPSVPRSSPSSSVPPPPPPHFSVPPPPHSSVCPPLPPSSVPPPLPHFSVLPPPPTPNLSVPLHHHPHSSVPPLPLPSVPIPLPVLYSTMPQSSRDRYSRYDQGSSLQSSSPSSSSVPPPPSSSVPPPPTAFYGSSYGPVPHSFPPPAPVVSLFGMTLGEPQELNALGSYCCMGAPAKSASSHASTSSGGIAMHAEPQEDTWGTLEGRMGASEASNQSERPKGLECQSEAFQSFSARTSSGAITRTMHEGPPGRSLLVTLEGRMGASEASNQSERPRFFECPPPSINKLKIKRLRLASSQSLSAFHDGKWKEIFKMQHSEGYWECTGSLGSLLGVIVNMDLLAGSFLQNKGIASLGVRAHAEVLRLLATLLVLQLIRLKKLQKGLNSLFQLDESPQPRTEHWMAIKKAVKWVCWADRQYPCICSRLELGWSWESVTRQLLGHDSLPPLSTLHSLTKDSPIDLSDSGRV